MPRPSAPLDLVPAPVDSQSGSVGLWPARRCAGAAGRASILNAETRRAFGLAEVKAQLAAQGIDAVPGTPEAFAAFIRQETDKWAGVVRESGAKAD